MSKKVLRLAGQPPMLLALIMATLPLGLLFSGWLTPMPSMAQPSQNNPTPAVETTNCEPSSDSTQCVTEASVTLTSVPTTCECFGSGVGASTTVATTLGEAIITTSYTNAGNSGNGNCPDTYSTNTTPTLISNWWSASGCGIGTNGTGLSATGLMPKTGGDVMITFNQKWQHICDTNTEIATTVATIHVIQIAHECVATTPTNQDRTIIGVGEEVDLSLAGAPSGSFTWSTSAGDVSPKDGVATTFTAPDRAATAVITVTNNDTGDSCTLSFSVIEPSGVYFVTNKLYHTYDEADVGFHALIYLQPASVNFYAVQCQEEQAYAVANGVYAEYNGSPHELGPVPFSFGSTVVRGLGTGDATGSGEPNDTCYSGSTDSSLHIPFTNGTEKLDIPWDFKVGSGTWKTGFITLTWNCSKSDGGWDNEGILRASKANARVSCAVADPSLGTP